MKFQVATSYPRSADALVVRIAGGQSKPSSPIPVLSKKAEQLIASEIKRRKFKAGVGETLVLPAPDGNYRWLLIMGIGKDYDPDSFRKSAAAAAQAAKSHHLETLVSKTPGGKVDLALAAQAKTEGSLLAEYEFHKYKSKSKRKELTLTFVAPRAAVAAMKRGCAQGRTLAEATILARDLVNEPPSELTPTALARQAKEVARRSGLRATIFGPTQIKRLGLNGYLAVAKGSDEPPQFIKLEYRPTRTKKHVVLVGKGITFDAGGLNLKPSRGGMLETMKMDMAGAAAVIGAMSALKKLNVKVRVTGYIAATENLLGGSAYKPGDVVKTYNGKTIEIGNTDAEGRVTLADVLAYSADRDKPDEMIDLATLTDTELSLGPDYAALFFNSKTVGDRLKKAGNESGEKLWELPLPENYADMTKSPVADFSNIVQNRTYTISGPLLLKNFVGKAKWAHLDIGGPAWTERDKGYWKRGGTGFGARLLIHYLLEK